MGQLQRLENYLFMGARVKPLLLSEDTGGNFSVFEFTEVQGLEPPVHIHENEDEMWRIIEGEATFRLENKEIHAGPGDAVFVPQGKPHTFKLKTKTMTAILSLTSTDFENIVSELAVQVQSKDEMPSGPPTKEQLEKLLELGKKYGLTIRPPEHTV
ncbi:cupin domain-containing protein [Planococcus shixiaomingii]|uniref:cupin domain-containing protein n=1 Tax=Planococcus shixiaomingii TaxID=3058393 RepID=UPI00261C8F19|nr:cupin domain-containing protein [Planococcus sp. N022]WKA55621.1 cupin domain-containing protein [Planococcus sp. N022]